MTTDDRSRRPAAATGNPTRRSTHAAPGGRILAAGLSASVAVGLVAVMARPRAEDVVLTVTHPQPAAAPADTAPTTLAPAQIIVVIVEDEPATAAPAPPATVTVPAPPATPAPKPAVTPATAKPDTKTRAS